MRQAYPEYGVKPGAVQPRVRGAFRRRWPIGCGDRREVGDASTVAACLLKCGNRETEPGGFARSRSVEHALVGILPSGAIDRRDDAQDGVGQIAGYGWATMLV